MTLIRICLADMPSPALYSVPDARSRTPVPRAHLCSPLGDAASPLTNRRQPAMSLRLRLDTHHI